MMHLAMQTRILQQEMPQWPSTVLVTFSSWDTIPVPTVYRRKSLFQSIVGWLQDRRAWPQDMKEEQLLKPRQPGSRGSREELGRKR